jgi:hypothetical protein
VTGPTLGGDALTGTVEGFVEPVPQGDNLLVRVAVGLHDVLRHLHADRTRVNHLGKLAVVGTQAGQELVGTHLVSQAQHRLLAHVTHEQQVFDEVLLGWVFLLGVGGFAYLLTPARHR